MKTDYWMTKRTKQRAPDMHSQYEDWKRMRQANVPRGIRWLFRPAVAPLQKVGTSQQLILAASTTLLLALVAPALLLCVVLFILVPFSPVCLVPFALYVALLKHTVEVELQLAELSFTNDAAIVDDIYHIH